MKELAAFLTISSLLPSSVAAKPKTVSWKFRWEPSSHCCAAPGMPAPSMSTQIAKSATTVVGERQAAPKGEKFDEVNYARFKVVAVIGKSSHEISIGDIIVISRSYALDAKMGLLSADADSSIAWTQFKPIRRSSIPYVKGLLPLINQPTKRLAFCAKHVAHDDPTAAFDAFKEIYSVDWTALIPLSGVVDCVFWRKLLTESRVSDVTRLSCARLLSACGGRADEPAFERLICDPKWEKHTHREHIMVNYLLLAGERGIRFLEERVVKPKWRVDSKGRLIKRARGEKQDTFAYKYGALYAIRVQGHFGNCEIDEELIVRSLKRFHAHNPELASYTLSSLSLRDDWTMADEFARTFETSKEEDVRRACVRYIIRLLVNESPNAAQKRAAKRHLDTMRKAAPDLVQRERSIWAPLHDDGLTRRRKAIEQ